MESIDNSRAFDLGLLAQHHCCLKKTGTLVSLKSIDCVAKSLFYFHSKYSNFIKTHKSEFK